VILLSAFFVVVILLLDILFRISFRNNSEVRIKDNAINQPPDSSANGAPFTPGVREKELPMSIRQQQLTLSTWPTRSSTLWYQKEKQIQELKR